MKKYLPNLPLISKPVDKDDLYLYLAVLQFSFSVALVWENLEKKKSAYYVSKSLLEPETRYPKMEKLILTFVTVARKLWPYFQSFRIVNMTEYPLRSILHNLGALSRTTKWAIELG